MIEMHQTDTHPAILASDRCRAHNVAQGLCNRLTVTAYDAATNSLPLQNLNKPITVLAPIGKIGSRHKVMGIIPPTHGGRKALS